MSPNTFQQALLSWFDQHGRKNLPWQQPDNPYYTWLSEIMLQQTQVITVIPYFERFISRFPNLQSLAEAPLDQVLQLWSGLGYYARARNLHKTAIIIQQHGGVFPRSLDELLELPGIGRSTAGAILSISFNQSQAILDGNVRRVFARYFAISGWTGDRKINQELWQISSRYTPLKRCADYTQAIMDLGATLCTRSKPNCEQCPVRSHCQARIENKSSVLPTPRPRKKLAAKSVYMLLLQNPAQQILLEKRPETGIWGGLWSLPEFQSLVEIEDYCREKNFFIRNKNVFSTQRHTFSHYHLDYTAVQISTDNPNNIVMEANSRVWYNTEQVEQLGLASPIKRLLDNLQRENDDKNS